MRILIVDDEEMIRMFLSDYLCREGHAVETACDGQAGLAAVTEGRFDLVISDIKMPLLDGVGMLERIRELPESPPVLMLTGYAEVETAVKALRLGAYDYMLKPVQPHDLLNRLSHLEKLRELEAEARREHERALHVSRLAAVGQLSAGVAHEINNPTTYVRGSAQLLEAHLRRLRSALDEGGAEALRRSVTALLQQMPESIEAILRGTERIKRITTGLLSFSGERHGEERSAVDLNACVQQAATLLGERDEAVALELRLADDLPAVPACRQAVTQALLCLLTNALQAVAGAAEKRVVVLTARGDAAVRVEVCDSGPGVDAALRECVFDPFFTTRDVNDGTGLGLSVAHGIVVNDHGGTISVEDADLGGACFRIELPLER